MNPVRCWFLLLPQRRLGLVTVPGVLVTGNVTVEDGLVLKLITAETPGEGVFGPDDLASDGEARRFHCILKLALARRAMANVDGGARFHDAAMGPERVREKSEELLGAHIVAGDLQMLSGIAF